MHFYHFIRSRTTNLADALLGVKACEFVITCKVVHELLGIIAYEVAAPFSFERHQSKIIGEHVIDFVLCI